MGSLQMEHCWTGSFGKHAEQITWPCWHCHIGGRQGSDKHTGQAQVAAACCRIDSDGEASTLSTLPFFLEGERSSASCSGGGGSGAGVEDEDASEEMAAASRADRLGGTASCCVPSASWSYRLGIAYYCARLLTSWSPSTRWLVFTSKISNNT